ncbi:hypothetical protein [Enterococcus ureasiticus]|uniref:Lipoprotein n=1 Tax=Enterococcus ureasiticus TaxID=903984 RepID=A0A1E5G7D4_9ENTE|nr:hypothetical protein [Enterococcus ureasiticus]OEG08633.1 hypothetical protein BCR21_16080 [Enterococcus ureasiticus]
MKKAIIICLGMFLLLAGCSNGKTKETLASSSEGNASSNSLVSESKSQSTSNSAQATTSKTAEHLNSQETSTSDGNREYPYEVSLNELKSEGAFTRNGMNIPQRIELTFEEDTQGIASFINTGPEREYVTSFAISYQSIPTKAIRIFSAETNEIRTVYVNTELVLGNRLSSDQGRDMSGNLYVFINKSGNLSLATPNYAGNVETKDFDIMLEYLPK